MPRRSLLSAAPTVAPARRWWRRPPVHFACLGALLFTAHSVWPAAPAPAASASRPTITISAGRIAELRGDFARAQGRAPSADEERALVDQAIEEELLYREALALGLDRGDRSVEWRLAEKMRFLTGDGEGGDVTRLAAEARALELDRDDPVLRHLLIHKLRLLPRVSAADAAADDAALRRYYRAHREEYRQPARVSLTQVFLSRARHGEQLPRHAADLLATLRATRAAPASAATLGEPFAGGHSFAASSHQELRKRFGDAFADAVFALPAGEWAGPVSSPYGLHLVHVDAHHPSQFPHFDAIASRVRRRMAAELREQQLAQLLAELRRKYQVRLETRAVPQG